ncbi:hypothetical protein MCOR27_010308 [Pyricularia oryzae]|uniref:Uncharacterized protein n=4 Tax=Pyricularia TaxID=48558 RepID=A0ABQ8N6C9_PYRGI|nr:uncharacterized protein MGG_16827 [Pyricularia oryzae 70-15]ELQ34828.1 hypothetical protein OOU_Y34scaffold00745g103 [Pyricularia oryzae Y34]KAH8847813.1 hypothetical protein MCOR01_001210 [Pyricularia oryzae]KAI6292027.1 hypothetical protein MCOR33_010178 [Pyricularia grisea]EHA52614.1 hypothetical protein MGG_16827 [Pyricularia oryzae 70-15]KAI6268112.1 hypothetical protein MCOR27_010308 [Pyricularia oryzae]
MAPPGTDWQPHTRDQKRIPVGAVLEKLKEGRIGFDASHSAGRIGCVVTLVGVWRSKPRPRVPLYLPPQRPGQGPQPTYATRKLPPPPEFDKGMGSLPDAVVNARWIWRTLFCLSSPLPVNILNITFVGPHPCLALATIGLSAALPPR